MLTIYQLKPRFQAMLRPIVKILANNSITANQITVLACLGSLLVTFITIAILPHQWILMLLVIWMFFRMALNAIDGMLAREFGQKTNLGAYLNEICDIISDSALFCVFIYLPDVNVMLIIIMIILSILTEYSGVLGTSISASRRYDGPMGKSDRAFIYAIICVGISLDLLPTAWLNTLFVIVIFLLVITVINRIKCALIESNLNKGK